VFWAGNVVLGRFVAGHIPPVTLSFIRWSGAFVILLSLALRHLIRDWPAIRAHTGLLAFLALTGFAVYNTMAYYGLQFTTPSTACCCNRSRRYSWRFGLSRHSAIA
jgi:drug/metabolite transporter (DMT)-like permease